MKRSILFFFWFTVAGFVCAQPGSADLNFDSDGRAWVDMGAGQEAATAVMSLPDGKIVLSGMVQATTMKFGVTRLNPDGSVDNTFGFSGKVITDVGSPNAFCYDGGLTPDGKILQVGYGQVGLEIKIILVRYLSNGALDNSFGNGGIATIGMAGVNMAALGHTYQSEGKLVLTGLYDDGLSWFLILRVNDDGSLDTTFNTVGYKKIAFGVLGNNATDVVVQPDGKIVVVGESTLPGNEQYAAVTRLLPDGQEDPNFGSASHVLIDYGSYDNKGRAVVLQNDGKIVVGGNSNAGGDEFFTITRLLPDGILDPTYGNGGKSFCTFSTGHAYVQDMTMQADGKVILAGRVNGVTDNDMAMVRYDSDGSLDPTFGSAGRVIQDFGAGNDQAFAVNMQDDQLILLAGNSDNGTEDDFAVARFISGVNLNIGELTERLGSILVYPNPIQSEFVTEFEVKGVEGVNISLIGITGEKIADLYSARNVAKGAHRVPLSLPEGLAAGQYIIQLKTDKFDQAVKVLITK